MEDKPKICIYLENASQIKVVSASDFMGRPVNLLFDVDEFKTSTSRSADLGNLIVSILSTWHRQEFANAAPPINSGSTIFGELEIVESLIARSVKHSTIVHSDTIDDLLLNHAASGREDVWQALAEDWPKIRSHIDSSNKKI